MISLCVCRPRGSGKRFYCLGVCYFVVKLTVHVGSAITSVKDLVTLHRRTSPTNQTTDVLVENQLQPAFNLCIPSLSVSQ